MLYINSNEQFDECKTEISDNSEIIQNIDIENNNNNNDNNNTYLVVVNINSKINKLLSLIKYSTILLSIVIIFLILAYYIKKVNVYINKLV